MRPPLKIAFLHFFTLRMRRGVETMVLSLANALAERDVDVSILTARRTQAPLVQPSPRVRLREFPTFRYYEFASIVPFYVAVLVRQQYDIVIAFFADFGGGLALRLAAPFAQPRLFLYLTFPYESAPHRYHAYRRWGWDGKATCILADAAYTARRGEEFLGRPVQVLPSGTDPERFKPNPAARAAMRRQLGFAEGDIILLNVSALERRKGVWRVIEALPEIRAHCPTVHYLVLGEGPEKQALQERARELGLSEAVTFAGTTADLPPYYNAADIFVMLPDAEAGSVACLEAMACGLPVVVSDGGGFEEVVTEQCGRLVDMNRQTAIADSIVELSGRKQLRAEMGTAGRQEVIDHFSWKQIGFEFRQLCEQSLPPGF